MSSDTANPFPGLRPFDPSENHLFFGRDRVIDELLARLRRNRFLAVIGSSGCGKSSVVRAGMVPALYGGHMTRAGSSWRIAIMRPGTDPIGNLATALNEPGVLGDEQQADATAQIFRETTLRRSRRGLTDTVLQSALPADDNVLVIVDQFEELFRFKRRSESAAARDEALAFVKRLISASEQDTAPIYVALTMRSDFIGHCIEYPGLPEALNEGQYLVPRMTREELRASIRGPVAVAGGDIAPRLTTRLLNETGDDPDQLPVLQHALMRTWEAWAAGRRADQAIDMRHYEAVGTMAHALSQHAEEAYADLATPRLQALAQRVFRALTDSASEQQAVRRPTAIGDLARIGAADEDEVRAVVERFRQPGTSFLMPPADIALASDTVVDLSHESLIRGWQRLRDWAAEERDAARIYLRIADAAVHYAAGTGGLWRDPELQLGLQWQQQTRPTAAWARPYAPDFDAAMAFLEKSRTARDAGQAAAERARKLRFRAVATTAIAMFAIAAVALYQWRVAERARTQANENLRVARQAVTEMLTEVGRESLVDVPQMEQVRAHLLARAQEFYEGFQRQQPTDDELRVETALARRALGDVHKLKGERDLARSHYQAARQSLEQLVQAHPGKPDYRYHLAATWNSLGEYWIHEDRAAAEQAYRAALALQQGLADQHPANLDYAHDLALTYNNLGIALRRAGDPAQAEQMYREAIERFDALAGKRDNEADGYRLSQAYNNLGSVLGETGQDGQAVAAYSQAIDVIGDLRLAAPANREYMENLAKYHNNLGNRYERLSRVDDALAANRSALELFEELAQPVPLLTEELANSFNTRGSILQRAGRADQAEESLLESARLLQGLARRAHGSAQLDERLGNTLANIGRLKIVSGDIDAALPLLRRAIDHHRAAVASAAPGASAPRNLANAWWILAEAQLRRGEHAAAAESAAAVAAAFEHENYLVNAARLLARAAEVATDSGAATAAERYADDATALLRRAVMRGYDAADTLGDDSPFRILHDRPGFQALLENTADLGGSGVED